MSLQAPQRLGRASVLRRGYEVTSGRVLGYTIFTPGQMKSICRAFVHIICSNWQLLLSYNWFCFWSCCEFSSNNFHFKKSLFLLYDKDSLKSHLTKTICINCETDSTKQQINFTPPHLTYQSSPDPICL